MQHQKQFAIVTTIAALAALMIFSTVTSEQVNAQTSAKALKAQIKALKAQLKAAKAAKKATNAAKLQAKIKKLQARLAAVNDTGSGAQAATGSTGGDSQSIHQANHNTQSTNCSANGGNGNTTGGAGGTNNCSNTNTQSNTNSGSNTHA